MKHLVRNLLIISGIVTAALVGLLLTDGFVNKQSEDGEQSPDRSTVTLEDKTPSLVSSEAARPAPDGWQIYNSERHGYVFHYPNEWRLKSGTDYVTIDTENGNPNEIVQFILSDDRPESVAAIVCREFDEVAEEISSGETVNWLVSKECSLPEERDKYGSGMSVKGVIPLRTGGYIHARAWTTTKPNPEQLTTMWNVFRSIQVR